MAEPTAKPRPNDLLPERFSEPTPIAPDDTPANRRYVPIMPQGGRYHSDVPDLDLAVLEERLRFYYSGAEVPDADAELTMLTRMVEERTTRLDEAERADAAL